MNISLIALGTLLIALFLASLVRPQLLFSAWVVAFLVFPTARAKIGEAPIYVYDIVALAVILSVFPRRELKFWPCAIPRWHWWFIGLAFLLSVIFGILQHGMAPEVTWIWLHSSFAWMAFAFGIIVAASDQRETYREAIAMAVFVSSIILCVIAIIQWAELPGMAFLSELFYGDIGGEDSVEVLRHGIETNRAPGPHFAPTGFAGMATLSVAAFWLVTDESSRLRRWLVFIFSAITVLCTVSRHAVLAAVLAILIAIALSESKKRVRFTLAVVLAALVIATPAVGFFLKEGWSHRLAKWDEGMLEDDNTAARIVWGPARLMDLISNEPLLLVTGAGLDPEKLAAKSKHESSFDSGFVSNGFLLMLYYLGVAGFLLHALFWLWAFHIATKFPTHSRGPICGVIALAICIVAADNYGVMYEPATALLFLLVGLVAGEWHTQRSEESPIEETSPTEETLAAKSYAT